MISIAFVIACAAAIDPADVELHWQQALENVTHGALATPGTCYHVTCEPACIWINGRPRDHCPKDPNDFVDGQLREDAEMRDPIERQRQTQ